MRRVFINFSTWGAIAVAFIVPIAIFLHDNKESK